MSQNPFNYKASYAILDYSRPAQARILLESIKKYSKIDAPIIYLVNGAKKSEEFEYALEFYRAGLIDELIILKQGLGGGLGHCDLFRWCRTPYLFFLQVDHELIQEIDPDTLDFFVNLIELDDYKYVDLAGNQGQGKYSDRANFWRVSDFNELNVADNAGGGPGIFTANRWNENYLQEKFKENDWKIAHLNPIFFKDCGKESVREYADGGKTLHFTDTKELFILNPLKEKNEWLNLESWEWVLVLENKWPPGQIPVRDVPHSFKYWE